MDDKKTIFLSYHREDSLGYVNKLEKDLQHYFGKNYVVRDIDEKEMLANSGVVLAIIGSRWEDIYDDLENNPADIPVFNELIAAKQRNLPVIPITINGAKLTESKDLESLNWLKRTESYDITDDGDRWSTDVFGLVSTLERQVGIERVKQEKEKSEGFALSNKHLVIAMVVALLIAFSFRDKPDSPNTPTNNPNESPGYSIEQNAGSGTVNNLELDKQVQTDQAAVMEFPNISGSWKSDNGLSFTFSKIESGRFMVVTVGFGRGTGIFSKTDSGKFNITMPGAGKGEYYVSSDGERIDGWFASAVDGEKRHGAFYRVE